MLMQFLRDTVQVQKTFKFDRSDIVRYRQYMCSCVGFCDSLCNCKIELLKHDYDDGNRCKLKGCNFVIQMIEMYICVTCDSICNCKLNLWLTIVIELVYLNANFCVFLKTEKYCTSVWHLLRAIIETNYTIHVWAYTVMTKIMAYYAYHMLPYQLESWYTNKKDAKLVPLIP